MRPEQNQEIHLAARPEGLPDERHFELKQTRIPELTDGTFLVKNLWMSVDPYMRGRMREGKSYIEPFEVGKPLSGGCVGKIIESKHSDFPEGAYAAGMGGWREYWISDGQQCEKVDPSVPLQHYLGALGMPGLTAYAGLRRIAQPKQGETIFVSSASGAVGSLVCQLAKRAGCTVIGSAGRPEKIEWLKNKAGVQKVINYKETDDLAEALQKAAPGGIDIYWDNVGGSHLEAAIAVMNLHGRLIECGMISGYNDTQPPPGPRNIMQVIAKRLLMQGFLVFDHADLQAEFRSEMTPLVQNGEIAFEETVVDGLENAPEAFLGLFRGINLGKMLVRLAKDDQ